jgi:hypothetical protein
MSKNSTLSDMSFEDPIQKNNDDNDNPDIDYDIETDDETKKTKTPTKTMPKKNKEDKNSRKKKISKYQIHSVPIKINRPNKDDEHFKLSKNHVIILLCLILSTSIFFNVYLYKKKSN